MLLIRIENFPNQSFTSEVESAIIAICKPWDPLEEGIVVSFIRHRLGSPKVAAMTIEIERDRWNRHDAARQQELLRALLATMTSHLAQPWRAVVRAVQVLPSDTVSLSACGSAGSESVSASP